MTETELNALLAGITPANEAARAAAHAHWTSLAKPLGGLGRLETMLEDAAALTGYDFTVPDSVDGYPDVTIAVLESEQLTEVQYSSGNSRLCLRKAPGSDDISGDFNQYAESNAVDVDGRSVTLQGNDGQVQLATWLDGNYTYSIGIHREDGTGLTADEMTGLVKATK